MVVMTTVMPMKVAKTYGDGNNGDVADSDNRMTMMMIAIMVPMTSMMVMVVTMVMMVT